MDMNRKSRLEDVLFILALVIPTLVSAACFVDSARQTAQLLAKHAPTVKVARA